MKIGVVTFPGSNCDYDCYKAVREGLDEEAVFLWHRDHDLQGVDAVFLPGGFSYGDYLRAGAIAALSPIMREVKPFAAAGGPVAGICNGFQILCEAGLLPGALIRNRSLKFRSRAVHLLTERADTLFTSEYEPGQVLEVPIAHGEGCYFAEPDGRVPPINTGSPSRTCSTNSRRTGRWCSATARRTGWWRRPRTPTGARATSPGS